MTPKMEKFCQEYLMNGGHGTDAVEAAGYKGSRTDFAAMASKMLKMDEIKEYLAGHAKEACEETQLSVQTVLVDLEWAKGAAKEGYPTKEGTRKDLTSYIKACELQGKYLKMWVDKIEVNANGHLEIMKIIKERNGQAS